MDVPQRYQAGFLISKIQKIGQQLFKKMLLEDGITIYPGHGRVLYVLWKNGGSLSIKELIRKTGLQKTTLHSILEVLESEDEAINKKKQIVRIPSKGDKREKIVMLTPENQIYHSTYEKVSKKMEEIYYKGFTDEDKKELDKFLCRILTNLDGA